MKLSMHSNGGRDHVEYEIDGHTFTILANRRVLKVGAKLYLRGGLNEVGIINYHEHKPLPVEFENGEIVINLFDL